MNLSRLSLALWVGSLPILATGAPMHLMTEQYGPMTAFGAGAIYIPCAFDSHGEECLVDTGSDSSNIFDDRFAETYPIVGFTMGAGLSGAGSTCADILINRFDLGGITLTNQKIMRCPSKAGGGIAQGNVAGLASFLNQLLHFDFTAKIFSLGEAWPRGLKATPLTVQPDGYFGFGVAVGALSANALVDTGMAMTVVDRDFIGAHGDEFTFVQNSANGVDAHGAAIPLDLYRMKTLRVGDATFTDVYVVGADLGLIKRVVPNTPIVLGYNVIAQRNWYFDLGRKLWAIAR